MKKCFLAAVCIAASALISVPASAQSANHWIRYDEARDPGYQRAIHSGGRYYGGSYSSYDYPVYVQENVVKRNTAKRNGRYYKNCPAAQDPAVPIDTPCYAAQQPASAFTGSSVSSYIENGYLVTASTDQNGRQTIVSRTPVNR